MPEQASTSSNAITELNSTYSQSTSLIHHGGNTTEESLGKDLKLGTRDEENDSDNDDALINFKSRKE